MVINCIYPNKPTSINLCCFHGDFQGPTMECQLHDRCVTRGLQPCPTSSECPALLWVLWFNFLCSFFVERFQPGIQGRSLRNHQTYYEKKKNKKKKGPRDQSKSKCARELETTAPLASIPRISKPTTSTSVAIANQIYGMPLSEASVCPPPTPSSRTTQTPNSSPTSTLPHVHLPRSKYPSSPLPSCPNPP